MSDAAPFLVTWRTQALAGDRLVTDGLVRPEHRGPSPDLAAFLAAWPGAWYWADDARHRLVLVRGTAPPRPERWLWHGALLLAAILCTLAAGAVIAHVWAPTYRSGIGGAVVGTVEFAEFILAGGWRDLLPGWRFAAPLLGILLVHELGHYVAARRYAIDVSPPYFLPVPAHLSPIGNLGAFLRIRSPVYDRRQLLDVGAAGPLAGFVVAVAVLLWGYQDAIRVALPSGTTPSLVRLVGPPIVLGDSILTHALREWVVPGAGAVLLSPAAFAGWVGMFITALNLLPLSQLDGGHVLYGLAGRRQVAISLGVVAVLLVLGQAAPVWWLWVALTFVIGGGRWAHPSVIVPDRPVHRRARVTGWLCILVLVLTFVPVPFSR